MTERLYPTKSRLELLAQMDNGQVLTDITAEDSGAGFPVLLYPDAPTTYQHHITVTARARELEAAGWAEEREGGIDWQPTAHGRAIAAVRILDFGDRLVMAETGDDDDPRYLGGAIPGTGRTWLVSVIRSTDQVACRNKSTAREELRHMAALALIAHPSREDT